MHCTNCSAQLPAMARFCTDCGVATAPKRQASAPLTIGEIFQRGSGLMLVAFVLAVMAMCTFDPTPDGKAAGPQLDATEAAAKLKACNGALDDLTKRGLIKARPAANRIEVDELAWASLPAQDKEYVVLGVRCSVLAGYNEESGSGDLNDVTSVYGYHSGKILASAVKGSVTLD